MFDALLNELLALKAKLTPHDIPLIIGGGMGLYLRDRFLPAERQPHYPVRPESRSTQDLDVFLSADLIVNADKVNHLRDALQELGYEPVAKYFQFSRTIELAGQKRTVKVDLLAAPPRPESRSAVKISKPRIKPKGSEAIHGFLTPEAQSIERGMIPVNLSEDDDEQEDAVVYIPSSFNYLILKLHAFDDQKENPDPKKDYGRHHTWDIFRIVTDMTEDDWTDAQEHFIEEQESARVQRAVQVRADHFGAKNDLGFIRLRENQLYQRYREEYDTYLSDVRRDLADLLPQNSGSQ